MVLEKDADLGYGTFNPIAYTNFLKEVKSNEILEEAWYILNNERWKKENKSAAGDVLFSQKLENGGGKVFRLIGTVEAPINILIDIVYNHTDEFPSWNPSVKESKVLQKLSDDVDITYQMSTEHGKGLVSSRDFVMLRYRVEKDGFLVVATASVDLPTLPPLKNIVRAEHGPGCWAFKQIAAFETEVRWLVHTNIRGWIPQYAVDSAMLKVMSENMINIRKRAVQLQNL